MSHRKCRVFDVLNPPMCMKASTPPASMTSTPSLMAALVSASVGSGRFEDELPACCSKCRIISSPTCAKSCLLIKEHTFRRGAEQRGDPHSTAGCPAVWSRGHHPRTLTQPRAPLWTVPRNRLRGRRTCTKVHSAPHVSLLSSRSTQKADSGHFYLPPTTCCGEHEASCIGPIMHTCSP